MKNTRIQEAQAAKKELVTNILSLIQDYELEFGVVVNKIIWEETGRIQAGGEIIVKRDFDIEVII